MVTERKRVQGKGSLKDKRRAGLVGRLYLFSNNVCASLWLRARHPTQLPKCFEASDSPFLPFSQAPALRVLPAAQTLLLLHLCMLLFFARPLPGERRLVCCEDARTSYATP